MFFNRITTLVSCIIISTCAFSQKKEPKIKFGDIKPEDFAPQVYSVDSSADAVYLDDIGSSHYEGNNNGDLSVVFKIHERIRLLHKNIFDDLGSVKIGLYKYGNQADKLDDLQAVTYTLEDGKVVITKVDKNSFFKDKDGDIQVEKFTFPNLKEGCIIEYSYTKTIPYFAALPDWNFQGKYPYLWSQYTVEIPQFYDFVVLDRGYFKPALDTVVLSNDNFNLLDPGGINAAQTVSFKSTTVKHTWGYENMPALKDENFITDLDDYRQGIEFQFSAFRFPNEDPKFYMHDWMQTATDLMKDEDFGADLNKENGWLKDDVKAAVDGETDVLKKAQNIYAFVRDNYTCTDYSARYLSQSLKKTQQSKKGNVVDINMLLIAMLKNAGYSADPVLLSTRGHGKTYDIYPIMDKFNYLIARVNMSDGNFYLLDASDPLLGFAHLNEDCYNGGARVIASNPIVIYLSADSLHESEIASFILTNDSSGKMTGTYKCVMGEMQSTMMREQIKKSSTEDYFKEVKKSFSFDAELNNTTIDSLKQFENPVSVQYEVSFKPEDDIIYFNPLMPADARKENPFTAAKRFYPVEMPFCMDETYVMNMEVPHGYKVDELPKPARVTLNDNEGMFEYLIVQNGDNIQLRCRTKLNKANFEPDDYETLRSFFAFVVQKENEQIVFKKM